MRLAYSRFIVCICVLLAAGCSTISPEERVASFDEGVRLYDAGQYEDAYKIFDGLSYVDAAAARNAALMLRKGQGVEKDPAEAKRLFQFAAQAGLATAAADLGEMLLLGEGGPPDPAQALPWLQMASRAHHAIAEYHLGMMYETGNGVDKDVGMAKKLYADSAASGMEEAAARLKALGGEPPPLRSTTEDTSGPSRESLPPGSQPPEAAETLAAPEAAPEPSPAADDKPKSADDYQDISTPDFEAPDESPDAREAPDMEPPDIDTPATP
jgi:TPR repeat protein